MKEGSTFVRTAFIFEAEDVAFVPRFILLFYTRRHFPSSTTCSRFLLRAFGQVFILISVPSRAVGVCRRCCCCCCCWCCCFFLEAKPKKIGKQKKENGVARFHSISAMTFRSTVSGYGAAKLRNNCLVTNHFTTVPMEEPVKKPLHSTGQTVLYFFFPSILLCFH